MLLEQARARTLGPCLGMGLFPCLQLRLRAFQTTVSYPQSFPDPRSTQSPLLPLFSFIAPEHSELLVYILGSISSMSLSQCNPAAFKHLA